MNINDAFPSKFLKASDLNNKRHVLTIDRVVMEGIQEGDPDKPVVYFKEAQKGMVLNQTNAMNISMLYGPETEQWPGNRIELYTAVVTFKGQNVPAIRIMAPSGPPPETSAPNAQAPMDHDLGLDPDDTVPF